MKGMTMFLVIVFQSLMLFGWGFFAHKHINQLAVFCLPPALIGFYKQHVDFIREEAVSPDKRRYVVKEEAARHYIDLDAYPDSIRKYLAKKHWTKVWKEDSIKAHGILPWHIIQLRKELTEAFRVKNTELILRLSADLGHYIADAHVPLHTTRNYNGQLTNQHGIHGLWESRLPELFFDQYNFYVGMAEYRNTLDADVWEVVFSSHAFVEEVLLEEKKLNQQFPSDKKYTYEERGSMLMKVYSKEYARAYHESLNQMVEKQMKSSVKFLADFWYTCWVDGGMPDLTDYYFQQEQKMDQMKNEGESDYGCKDH